MNYVTLEEILEVFWALNAFDKPVRPVDVQNRILENRLGS